MPSIEERAQKMTGAEKEAYLLTHGWQWTGMGYIAPGALESTQMDGALFTLHPQAGGLFSRTTAILEQLARENPDRYPQPNELGRYYQENP